MIAEDLMKKISEAEEKARMWDSMSARYVEVSKIITDAMLDINSGMDKLNKALKLVDPMAHTQMNLKESNRGKYDYKVIVSEQETKLRDHKEVSMDSLMKDYPNIPSVMLQSWFSAKLGKIEGVQKKRDGRKLILFIE